MDQDEEEKQKALVAQQSSPSTSTSTLLPSSIANAVSLVTRSSSLYLRLGTLIGGLALDGARVTTLTSLELSRALIESILIRSGRDVAERSTGEIGRAEAEGILEKSVATLHRTITTISFAASTGFYCSAAALSSAADLSQQLLATLDSILGSTDSSRAIASIVTLIRREFQNPATGNKGEKVTVADLLLGICGLVLLQRWCRRLTDAESREGRFEEVVWDVVILNDGRRADVAGNLEGKSSGGDLTNRESMSFMTTGGDVVLGALEQGAAKDESDEDMAEFNLRQKIMQSLPADASASITTSTTTTKTITVDITSAQPPDISPPPGIEIVEENAYHMGSVNSNGEVLTNDQKVGLSIPKYRVVYRTIRNKLRDTNVEARGSLENAIEDDVELPDIPAKEPQSPGFSVSPLSSDSDEGPELPRRPSRTSTSKKLPMPPPTTKTEDKVTGMSAIPVRKSIENIANQKRSRKPMSASSSISGSDIPPPKRPATTKSPTLKKSGLARPPAKSSEKKGSFRQALKKGSGSTLSSLWTKDHSAPEASAHSKPSQKPPWGVANAAASSTKSSLPTPQRNSSIVPVRDAPRPPQRGNPNYFSSRDLGLPGDVPRSPSRASYYSIHEHRRDSLVSQTDTYSIHSADTRPGSPTAFRTHLRAQSNVLRTRSEKNIVQSQVSPEQRPRSYHRRSKSHVPSIYTLKTNNSATSLILAPRPRKSAFADSETLENLARTGSVDGLFPQHHIVRNITRFVRFASASYGASFLRVMGITSSTAGPTSEIDTAHHHEHHSFSSHTQLPAQTILLSSFVDPQGGTDSSGHTNTGVPMVHFVSLDHDSKAVILTCRGTMGFEDVLADMTCDYDSLPWRGQDYSVHKGIHASARRLLDGGGGRVIATIAAALEEFPDYGLVMCGHSLGGGVTALLAIMISEPSPDPSSTAFITSTSSYSSSRQLLLTDASEQGTTPSAIHLPPGRPIHVYAYGPPACLSPSLRLATRGLITTIVNNQDLVPYLSLGVLHDLQACALAFKTDDSGAKGEVRNRVWAGITGALRDKWYSGTEPVGMGMGKDEDDEWAYATLKTLRAAMLSAKLVPPGEVFVVESCPVLKRDAFVRGGAGEGSRGLGIPATRAVLRYVRDVEKRFRELRFGGSMLLDHSPGRYEASLGALGRGVLG
ncbi:Sn1-specific diacylglycerol lipase alpha [Lachnellula occidentalis]|uniref:sn-1-specific diacylglycerol lipase n=1 Tax=Lachnellula occidentalis TaxID=215460 RepID=A0A8H8RYP3_9HELO|nr:Sn1-specific diacylglycerol lipase alpha [Lachnellula occidentalis]